MRRLLRDRCRVWSRPAGSARDGGQALAVELLAALPVFLGVFAAILYVGRVTTTTTRVTGVAQSAARAASLATYEQDAAQAAIDTVNASSLTTSCRSLAAPVVSVIHGPGGGWRGGSVRVTVRCDVRNADLASLWVPGTHTLVATDTQAVDGYRT